MACKSNSNGLRSVLSFVESMLNKSRVWSLWLVFFLVGLRTYQHPLAINANSNQNYFQFHGSHYKYEKGVPLGLATSKSTFKKFLQNLEGEFIKSSSKSKALIRYLM